MAIADTITSMQNHTSNAYTMIGYGTDLTGINKNLENLSTSIFNAFLEALRTPDTLFTNLPKKSGTGANITLNDTANAPMRIELGASELTQDGTPTPSSPQDIHTISGSNKVVVCGKNLFDKSAIESGKEISNGSIYNNSTWCVSDYIVVEYNQTYIKNINNGNDCIIYDKDKNKISTNDRRFSSNKITITEQNAKYIRINLPLSNLDTYQLEKGSTATTYEPYVSQEADIDLSSKNLAYTGWASNFISRVNDSTKARLEEKDNKLCLLYTSSVGYGDYDNKYIFKTNWKANTQYTISFDVFATASTGSINMGIEYTDGTISNLFATYNAWEHKVITSTANKTIKYMRGYYSTGNAYIDLDTFMVNEGTTALPYEEYYDYGEYSKIGNYEDKIFKNIPAFSEYDSNLIEGEWYIKKNIGKVVLDGTETFVDQAQSQNDIFYTAMQVSDMEYTTQNLLSNYFKKGNNPKNNNGTIGALYQNYLYFGINTSIIGANDSDSVATKTTAFKTWLGTHNTNIYYPIATPTYTQITGTLANQLENIYQKLLSYSGTTNISQVNNDLSFNLSVSAIEEL